MDELDRKIILELEDDGRKTSAQVAYNLNATKATVARRIQSIISGGLISIRAKPDPLRIGWRASALILIKADLRCIDSICDEIAQNIYSSHIGTLFGSYNIDIIADCDSCAELHTFIEKIKSLDGVRGVKPFFIRKFNKRFIRKDDGFYYDRINEVEPVELAAGDKEIIEKLIIDGRQTVKQLSKVLNRPMNAVRNRVSWLLAQGVLQVSAVVNPTFLGYRAHALVLLSFRSHQDAGCPKAIIQSTSTVLVATIVNEADICFLAHAATTEKLHDELKRILTQIDGVESIQILITAELKKRYYARFMVDEQQLLIQSRIGEWRWSPKKGADNEHKSQKLQP